MSKIDRWKTGIYEVGYRKVNDPVYKYSLYKNNRIHNIIIQKNQYLKHSTQQKEQHLILY